MISKYLSSIDGIAAYPIVALFIFVPFFVIVTFWVYRLDKSFVQKMSAMPLNDAEGSDDKGNTP